MKVWCVARRLLAGLLVAFVTSAVTVAPLLACLMARHP